MQFGEKISCSERANIVLARAQLANIGFKKRTYLRGRFCFHDLNMAQNKKGMHISLWKQMNKRFALQLTFRQLHGNKTSPWKQLNKMDFFSQFASQELENNG